MVVASPTVEDGGRYGGRWRAVRDEVTEEAVVVAGNRNKIVEVFFAWKKKKKTVYLRSLWFEFLLDVNLFTFWTEETLIEDKSLSFCTCNGERWRRLFSFYKFLKQEPHEFLRTMKQEGTLLLKGKKHWQSSSLDFYQICFCSFLLWYWGFCTSAGLREGTQVFKGMKSSLEFLLLIEFNHCSVLVLYLLYP